MNKKGFTLLELLAVIVVLAVIALIVTPFVTKAIEEAKKGAFKNSAYGLLEVAELYCSQESLKNGGEYRGERFEVVNHQLKSTSTNNILKVKGTTPVGESYVEIDEDCKVELNITNGTYFASIEDDETDITITEEELDSRETLAQRLNALTTTVNNQAQTIQTLTTTVNTLTSSVNDNNSISNIFLLSHAVGSIYTTVATDEDTATKMHNKYGGEWEACGSGKTLVGIDTSQIEFDTVNETGGEKTHALSENELPKLTGSFSTYNNGISLIYTASGIMSAPVTSSNQYQQGTNANGSPSSATVFINFGGNKTHNNLQPYITVYMWKRTS